MCERVGVFGCWWPVFLSVAVTLPQLKLIESRPYFLPWGQWEAEASFLIRKPLTDKKHLAALLPSEVRGY